MISPYWPRARRLALVLLCSLLGLVPEVRAELPAGERATGGPSEPPLLVRLAPTAEQREQLRTRALEQRLVRLISALPDVDKAQVDIAARESTAPLDRPTRTPRVAAVVTVSAEWSAQHTREAIQHIVSAVLPELAPDNLTVVARTRQAAPGDVAASAHSLVQIGPFLVHPQSASQLRFGLAGLLATNALLAAILLWRTRLVRARTARRTES